MYDISGAEDDSVLLKEEPKLEFSGEEGLGRWAGGQAESAVPLVAFAVPAA